MLCYVCMYVYVYLYLYLYLYNIIYTGQKAWPMSNDKHSLTTASDKRLIYICAIHTRGLRMISKWIDIWQVTHWFRISVASQVAPPIWGAVVIHAWVVMIHHQKEWYTSQILNEIWIYSYTDIQYIHTFKKNQDKHRLVWLLHIQIILVH